MMTKHPLSVRRYERFLLSAVTVIAAIIATGSVLHADARAEPRTAPVRQSGATVLSPVVDPALARLEADVLGSVMSGIEPTSGEPSPQMLGGSDDGAIMPMPAPIESTPVPAPMAEAPVAPTPVEPPAPVQPIVTEVPAPPAPDAAVLEAPAPEAPPSAGLVAEPVSGDSVTSRLTPEPVTGPKKEQYYDSTLKTPTGPLSKVVGPRKSDPAQEPASKFIVSTKMADKDDVEAQMVAANRALDLARYESALEMFDQLYKRNQRDARILMGRAVAQQKLGMDDVAILSYEAVLDLAPNNTDAIVNMMGLLKKQYPAVALRRLTDLRDKFPANAGVVAQLGMVYAEMGDNQQALQALGTASSLDPANAQHAYNMAVVADRAGSKVLAVQYYEQALQTDAVYGGGRSIPREKIYDRLSALRR